ncbi:MAG TPA: hypothetical protein VFN56_00535, partial [Candidatus Saccharimonadales bacterium]|nr:hypothetical protein [Candidatus Saccharimonadales bacterium]
EIIKEQHPLFPNNAVPLFIAPGVLKYPAQLNPFMDIDDPMLVPTLGIGGFTHASWKGNSKVSGDDFVYYPKRRMAGNSRGLPNPGREGILALRDPIRRLTELGIKSIVQVTNLPHETPIDVIPMLVSTAAEIHPTAIEVNLSCPNGVRDDGGLHAPLCNDPESSGRVMEAARLEVGGRFCLGAKDSPHVHSLDEDVREEEVSSLLAAIINSIDYVAGINTIGNQAFSELTSTNGRGGMSGPVVAPIAHQHLQICKSFAPDLAYLSCGGVDYQNADVEVPSRLAQGAMLVGGAQDFYRAKQPHVQALRWCQAVL